MCTAWIRLLVVAAACITSRVTFSQTLEFSTYWGTGGANNRTVVIDRKGYIYMSGGTSPTNWPTTLGAAHAGGGESDVTIAKFSPEGKLIWSRLLGGPLEDYAYVSTVGTKGELYVSGRAGSGFPTTPNAFDRTFNGGIGGGPHKPTDAFVVKLSPGGELLYSTYIGGNGDDNGRAIHLLPSGKLIVAGGNTTSTDLPTDRGTIAGPVLKPQRGGDKDSWVAILSADGASVDFCTYFGPVVDPRGNVYCTGRFRSTDCPVTQNAFQKRKAGNPGTQDAVLVVFSPDGQRLLCGSYFGGSNADHGRHVGIHPDGRFACIIGETGSKDLPLLRAAQSTPSGAFLVKFAIPTE